MKESKELLDHGGDDIRSTIPLNPRYEPDTVLLLGIELKEAQVSVLLKIINMWLMLALLHWAEPAVYRALFPW